LPDLRARKPLEWKSRSRIAIVCTLVWIGSLGLAGQAQAKLYKWVDASGKASFGTTPPPPDYAWVDERGVFYNRAAVDGKNLTYIGTAPEKKVETRGPLKRSPGFGAGKSAAWDSSQLRSAQPVQVGLKDQFLPIDGSDKVVVGLTGSIDKGSDCFTVEFDNRGDATLTEVRAAFTLYTSNVFIGDRVITVPELPKGTKTASICEGAGHVSFADGMALDHMTWKVGGEQKNWPSPKS